MIGQIIGSLGGLAKSYIDAKTAVKITEADKEVATRDKKGKWKDRSCLRVND